LVILMVVFVTWLFAKSGDEEVAEALCVGVHGRG